MSPGASSLAAAVPGLTAVVPGSTAAVPGLTRSDPSSPGITRERGREGFRYRDPSGVVVTQPEALQRIGALAIPPAWTNVWISPDPLGHIQATGVDSRGRTQYRYHEHWREQRDAQIAGRAGGHFTAKEFRTWNATVLMALALANAEPARAARSRQRVVAAGIREVAGWLGDTPAVTRKSYIDPRLISRYESMGELPAIPAAPVALPAPAQAEIAVATLLAP